MCNPITTAHPERLLAKGVHEGFEWEVTDNGHAYRCGYVRVPAGHPWHGKDYDDVVNADVHGGLTFGEYDAACGKGGEDSAFWLGFDCAHAMDAPDPELPSYSPAWDWDWDLGGGGVVRSTEYVIAECQRLAEQAREAAA